MMKTVSAWVAVLASSVVACGVPPSGEPLAGGSQALGNGAADADKARDAGASGDASAAAAVNGASIRTLTMVCRSLNEARVTCALPAHGHILDVSLWDQLSDAACVFGESFGRGLGTVGSRPQEGIWVDHGCAGAFVVRYQEPSGAVVPAPAAPVTVAIYRGYNATVGDHLQGTVDGELAPEWYPEGVGFHVYASNDTGNLVALRSCLRNSDGHHFLTTDASECPEGVPEYQRLGVLGYLSPTPQDGLVAVVRCYHDGRDDHLSTTNASECSGPSGSPGFVNQGTQGYVLP